MDYSHEPHGVFFLIDSRSFYASVECVARGLNPLKEALVVMSEQENTNGGLILATSQMAKRRYGLQSNVSRQRDLPQDAQLTVAPPRMNLYIRKNLAINAIFKRFVAPADLWPYSIDESILDVTHSWRLFGDTPQDVARLIQQTVKDELGLYMAVGIGENPVQAKIALDIYAKHNHDFQATITYANVPDTIWNIDRLDSVWSIGHRTAGHLERMGIHTMWDLAHSNPHAIKHELGSIGSQLFAIAWGIDRAQLSAGALHHRAAPSLSNSQVLPRDYRDQREIELVITEIAEQVAARLRHHHKQCAEVTLGVGFSYAATETDGRGGFGGRVRLPPTNSNKEIAAALLTIFQTNWEQQVVRNLSVSCSRLSEDGGQQLSLLAPISNQIKHAATERVVDSIRSRFGFTKLVYAKSVLDGGTAINRASLVGGHNGGNSYE